MWRVSATLTAGIDCKARPLAFTADCGVASLDQLAVHEASVQSRRPVGVDVGHAPACHLSVFVHLSIHAASVLEAPQHTNTTHCNWAAANLVWKQLFFGGYFHVN